MATTKMAGAIETPSTPPPTPKTTFATPTATATILTPPPAITPTTPTRHINSRNQRRQQPKSQESPPPSSSCPTTQFSCSSSSSDVGTAQQETDHLNTKTPWGCQIQTYPASLAPKSLVLIHNPRPGRCRCRGREDVIVKDYILRWVSWRIDELKEHPVKATTWARASCEYLGLGGALDGILGRVERVFGGEVDLS